MNDKELILQAIEACNKSYAPYSRFNVGAALLTTTGKIYTGCNIENASFTPTICAERVAFFKAISDGERYFEKIAVVGGTNHILNNYAYPCGVCRQVMSEFCNDDFRILIAKSTEDYLNVSLSELLPYRFTPQHLDNF